MIAFYRLNSYEFLLLSMEKRKMGYDYIMVKKLPNRCKYGFLYSDHKSLYVCTDVLIENETDNYRTITADYFPEVIPIIVTKSNITIETHDNKINHVDECQITLPHGDNFIYTTDPTKAPKIPKKIYIINYKILPDFIKRLLTYYPDRINNNEISLKNIEKYAASFPIPPNAGFIMNFFDEDTLPMSKGNFLSTFYTRCPICRYTVSEINRVTGKCPTHGNIMINYHCNSCDLQFDDTSLLEKHIYFCPICCKYFDMYENSFDYIK